MSSFGRNLPHVYLKPGEMYVATEPTLVTTVLGSCVSVTMFSQRLRIGGICHGLLPDCREIKPCHEAGNCGTGARYVACAIRLMFVQFRQLGIRAQELEVKVFGGADMFSGGESRSSREGVGQQNLGIAFALLEQEGVQVKAADTGGGRGRKIHFYTDTGEI